jgi:hypothetical protein
MNFYLILGSFLSKYHKENPYVFGTEAIIPFNMNQVKAAGMFGGNSNWRGPIWMPINYDYPILA